MPVPITLADAHARGLTTHDGIGTFSNGSEWNDWAEGNCYSCVFWDENIAGSLCALEGAALLDMVTPELARLFGWTGHPEYTDSWEYPTQCPFFGPQKPDRPIHLTGEQTTMQVTLSREALKDALAAVIGAVPARSTLPVLGNVLLETADGGLRVTATDLDVVVSVVAPLGEVRGDGEITVPAKKLYDIAKELPPAPVTLTAKGSTRLTVECGQSTFKLVGLPKDEFPVAPSVTFAGQQAATKDLQRMIVGAAFAVSDEQSRPILNGVLWEVEDGAQRMVATNGHRLAKYEIPSQTQPVSVATRQFIVPPKALDLVRKLFTDDEATIDVGHGDNHIGFASSTATVLTRLIEGPYPNYEQVVPKDNDKSAVVNAATLKGALRRMNVVASDQTHRMRFSFSATELRINADTPDLGNAEEVVSVEYTGEPLEIGFNGSYLLEIVGHIPTDDVRLTFKAPERAVVIEPANWDDAAKYLCLCMPLRLQD